MWFQILRGDLEERDSNPYLSLLRSDELTRQAAILFYFFHDFIIGIQQITETLNV